VYWYLQVGTNGSRNIYQIFGAVAPNNTPFSDFSVPVVMYGSNISDIMRGAYGNDTFYGYGGSDTLNGSDGDDYLNVGTTSSFDEAYGGEGNDTIVVEFNSGAAYIYGNIGNDKIYAGGGIDSVIDGGEGNDLINITYNLNQTAYGGEGDDEIRLKTGTVYGENGSDTIVVEYNSGTAFAYGGEGNDKIYAGGGVGSISGGGAGDDLINTSYNPNQTASGVDGNDQLYVGAGGVMNGGSGSDVFHLGKGGNYQATIQDFQDGQDKLAIAIGQGINVNNLTFVQVGANTQVNWGNEILASLLNISSSSINASDFVAPSL